MPPPLLQALLLLLTTTTDAPEPLLRRPRWRLDELTGSLVARFGFPQLPNCSRVCEKISCFSRPRELHYAEEQCEEQQRPPTTPRRREFEDGPLYARYLPYLEIRYLRAPIPSSTAASVAGTVRIRVRFEDSRPAGALCKDRRQDLAPTWLSLLEGLLGRSGTPS